MTPMSTVVNEATSSIGQIIRSKAITIHFQPIISARQRTIMGLEALARCPMDGCTATADSLFQAATDEGLTVDLERLCCETAIASFARLPHRTSDLILFLNLGSWLTCNQVSAVGELHEFVRAAGLSPHRIAAEVLEAKIDDIDLLKNLVRLLRASGFLLVLDDVGAGHSNLNRIPLIKPDILKVDRSLITGIGGNFHKQETLKSLVGLSRKIGSLVVAEGVETEEEAISAMELGADLLQGYFLSRPSEDGALPKPGTPPSPGIESLAQNFKQHMVGKINARKLQHRRFNIILNEILCHLASADVKRFDEVLRSTIHSYPKVECVYVLDNGGIQVTETICNPNMRRRDRGMMFRPAPRGTDHSLKEYYYILLDVELQKYTTDPYVSFASGNICHTISTHFRDAHNSSLYVICIDVVADDRSAFANTPPPKS